MDPLTILAGFNTGVSAGINVFSIAKALLNADQCEPNTGFKKMNNGIASLSNDIKELMNCIKWEGAKIQYADICTSINAGIFKCNKINMYRKAKDEHNQKLYEHGLSELCAGDKLMTALTGLYDGITGKGDFRNSILDAFSSTTNGDRPKLEELSKHLLWLFVGGLVALATNQSILTNIDDAKTILTNKFAGSSSDIKLKIEMILQQCKDDFRKNAEFDITRVLQNHKDDTNKDILDVIHGKLTNKYNWLRFDCMVWDDCTDGRFVLRGDYIAKLHCDDKCAVAFYYQDLGDGYDATYKKAWEELDKMAQNWRCFTKTVMKAMTETEVTIEDMERCGQHVKYSGYEVWKSISNLRFGQHFVVETKCGDKWGIWYPDEDKKMTDLWGINVYDKSVYLRIKSVDKEFCSDQLKPYSKKDCVIS